MVLLDVDHNAAHHFVSPGDLHSAVVELKEFDPGAGMPLEFTLSERVRQPAPAQQPPNTERLDFISPALPEFWGRPIHRRGVVVPPPDYSRATKRYRTVYWTHGFSVNEIDIERMAAQYEQLLASGKLPPHDLRDARRKLHRGHARICGLRK